MFSNERNISQVNYTSRNHSSMTEGDEIKIEIADKKCDLHFFIHVKNLKHSLFQFNLKY